MGYYCIIEKEKGKKEKCCIHFSSGNEAKAWVSDLGRRLNYDFTDSILFDVRYVLNNENSIMFVLTSPVSNEIPIVSHNIIEDLVPRALKRERGWYGSLSLSQ
jgi:hypothetical protein